jgi:3D (Asp-Asp-Asp) domain-containing protein
LKKFRFTIGISLLAASSAFASHANNDTLVLSSRPPSPPTTLHIKNVVLTAYVPEKSTTATGPNANHPGIAAAFTMFPKGTIISIPNQEIMLTVDDTGRDVMKDAKHGICHIDLRVPPSSSSPHALHAAFQRALAIGRRNVDIYVIFPSKHSHSS